MFNMSGKQKKKNAKTADIILSIKKKKKRKVNYKAEYRFESWKWFVRASSLSFTFYHEKEMPNSKVILILKEFLYF